MKRSEVKENHESSVLTAFQKFKKAIGINVDILSKPEPPDAIISINGEESWVEITDAFITPQHARSITSSVSEDKEWIKSETGLINVNSFNETLARVINEKYKKESIQQIYSECGAGILIVGCFSPFHYPIHENLEDLKEIVQYICSDNIQIFKEIYFYDYDYKPVRIV